MKIGVLGGGQLGRMLAIEATKLGQQLYFLDKDNTFPAGQLSDSKHFITGDFTNFDDVLAFGKGMDILTIEIESVNTQALQQLVDAGVTVYPQPHVIDTIKDKGIQKTFYQTHDIPTSAFFLAAGAEDIRQKLIGSNWGFPFVQKSRTDGYDGKGVQVIKSDAELDLLWDVPSVIEEAIKIDKELAIIVARNVDGDMVTYDAVEMVFDPAANVLDYQLSPANILESIEAECKTLAMAVAGQLGIVGLLAVEFFLTKNGEILVNEVAPRTHNSGHHTIDACACSQFEQQLRILLGLPFGSTHLHSPSMMVNLLGEIGASGNVRYDGLDTCMKLPEVKIHIYGKAKVKPKRKMGHVNILSDDVSLAQYIKSQLKVNGDD